MPSRRLQHAIWGALLVDWLLLGSLGCQSAMLGPGVTAQSPPADGLQPESSIQVPVQHAEWAWEQIVDVVDDYFLIERERPVQVSEATASEGRIDTFPQVGATAFEPHRADSVGSYNCWESTFQTIRRRAELRIVPDGPTYVVTAVVYKELEDLPRPEHATVGAASYRHDTSLPSDSDETISRTQLSPYWIDLGRDVALEQQILAEIQARLGPIPPSPRAQPTTDNRQSTAKKQERTIQPYIAAGAPNGVI